ncbi:MAG: MATE family efflux transporter [Proteobacteria bacterium]|nr:MATE family efflux transporter [Pseudomonadota bacterium]
MMMNKNLTKTIKELILFSFPITIGQVSHMLIGAGDVFVASHHGRQTVAAMGIANGISAPIFLIGLGLLLGISPTLSKKRGENFDTSQYFYTCILYALIISVVFMSITISLVPIVKHLGFDPSLVPLIQDYLFLVSFSYTGAYIFIAIKEYLQSMEHVVFANIVSTVAVFLNVFLGYIMAFGIFIFPELGIRGLAYAAIIIRFLIAITIFIYSRRYSRTQFCIVKNFMKRVLKFSLPISMSILFEVLAFTVVMILIGRIGVMYAAIHSIALTLVSITYMVPLSISNGVGVKIAYFYGRKNLDRIKDFSKAALIISMTFMAFSGLCLYLFPETILRIFTPDTGIITAGVSIIIVCAAFQIFDGAQVTLSGILRGLGITLPTSIIVLIGYWLMGLPLGFYFGYVKGLNALGFWIGLAISLFIIAICLFMYLKLTLKRLPAKFQSK